MLAFFQHEPAFDATNRIVGRVKLFAPLGLTHVLFDGTMILLNHIVQIVVLPYFDRIIHGLI